MSTRRLTNTWRWLRGAVSDPGHDPELNAEIAERARQQAPAIWLLGKVQSGKTSIVHAITGSPGAEIGSGFRACTAATGVFDFPPDAPVIRFLDTRGLGEVAYDPGDELDELEAGAHVVLAVARAMDPQQQAVLDVLQTVRARHPEWAVVLAQTTLHEGYPDGMDHPPYEALDHAPRLEDLRRSLSLQAASFEALPGTGPFYAVPIDFTRPEDGYRQTHFGLDALLDALGEAGAAGMRTLLRELAQHGLDTHAQRARPYILGYAAAAGTTDAIPFVGFVTVPSIQAKLLHTIGGIYGMEWNRRAWREFAASLGTGTVLGIGLSLGARQLTKLIPAYGQTLGAAAAAATSFSVTYALGRAACHYLGTTRGGAFDAEGVARTYRKSLQEAFDIVRARKRSNAGDAHGAAHLG